MSGSSDAKGAPPAQTTPQEPGQVVLRFPDLRLSTWYRIAEIAVYRGLLPATKFRLAKFLNTQRLDRMTGRVEGLYGTDRVDGGVALAERYAYVHGIGSDRFWDDLKGLYRLGFAERVVAPAPGRRAVYALCLRADAIPSDLPEDLMRELRVWDLPEAEDPYEDAAYGRLTSRPAPAVEPVVVHGANRETQQLIAEMAAAPRWEHPAGSKAAMVAGTIRESAKHLGGDALDLRCTAVADRDRAAEMTARVHRLMTLGANGKPSPLYAKGFSQLGGFSSNGSSGLNPPNDMDKQKTTPSAATGKRTGQPFGDALSTVARRVMRRVWHSWRVQLGRGVVFLPSSTPEELSRSTTGDAWSDLHHTVEIALRRSTETELVDLLTHNIVRRNEWGEIVFRPDNLGRLAAWRLWRLINSRKDAHGYGRRRELRPAPHVQWWDEATESERGRVRARSTTVDHHPDRDRMEDLQEQERRREAARRAAEAELAAQAQQAAEEAKRRELTRRWRLDRYVEQSPTRRWSAGEPEHVDEVQLEVRRALDAPRGRTSMERSWQAAVLKARAEKSARRREQG